MTPKEAIEVRDIAIDLMFNVYASNSRKATKEACLKLLNDLIPDDIKTEKDSYGVLGWREWNSVESNGDRYPSDFWRECRESYFWGRVYTKTVLDICENAIYSALESLSQSPKA